MPVTKGAVLHELIRRIEALERTVEQLGKQAPRKATAKSVEK